MVICEMLQMKSESAGKSGELFLIPMGNPNISVTMDVFPSRRREIFNHPGTHDGSLIGGMAWGFF